MRVSALALHLIAVLNGVDAAPSTSSPDMIFCNIAGYQADATEWIDLDYLRGHQPDTAALPGQPGGKLCTRLSCQEGSAIYACNDNEFDVTVSLPGVADLAQDIMNEEDCQGTRRVGKRTVDTVQGQAFNSTGGWNVVVGLASGDSC